MTEFEEVLEKVRGHLKNRRLRVPTTGMAWSVTDTDHDTGLHLTISAAVLGRNFQHDSAAAPSFLICFAYWLEQVYSSVGDERRVKCRVEITGDSPIGNALLHFRRSLFLLAQYQTALPARFDVNRLHRWEWPPATLMLNEAGSRAETESTREGGLEHRYEKALCNDDLWSGFPTSVERVRRQFPVGLFNGPVGLGNEWVPAGKSQVDLWATSPDRKTLHLFELKAHGNEPLGILPEAVYYARLLHYARTRLSDGRQIEFSGDGANALRAAARIEMSMIAPSVHPLLLHDGHSPLEWLNEGMRADGVEFRIALFKGVPGQPDFKWLESSPDR
jgi:hypothetical protein